MRSPVEILQVRLLALELFEELYARSQTFKRLVAHNFREFLELVVGFRVDKPLPPPSRAAVELRTKALRLVVHWVKTSKYSQIIHGYDYLEKTLKLTFPEIDRRLATQEAEQRAQQQRARRLAHENYEILQGEWEEKMQEYKSLLVQLSNCLGMWVGETLGSDEEEWEDVGANVPVHNVEDDEELEAVLENAASLYKLISTRALPTLQSWMRVLGEVDLGEPGTVAFARGAGYLRAVTELRTSLSAGIQQFEVLGLDLTSLVQKQKHKLKGDGGISSPEPKAQDAFGDSSGGKEHNLPVSNPYHKFEDPTAAKQRKPAGRDCIKQAEKMSSSLPEHVRLSLAEKAPVLPAGPYTTFWDTDSAPRYVSTHGLEISNHWGPVDVHQELPKERVEEMYLYNGGNPAASKTKTADVSKGVTEEAGPSNPLAAVEGTKLQRQAEKAYNEAIIGGESSDSALARRLEQAVANNAGKRKVAQSTTVRERLRRKLLSGRIEKIAIMESMNAEAEVRRDKFGANQWDNK